MWLRRPRFWGEAAPGLGRLGPGVWQVPPSNLWMGFGEADLVSSGHADGWSSHCEGAVFLCDLVSPSPLTQMRN